MNIGEKIRARRMELGMTLEEVGNIVGVGKSTVRKWETGMIQNMKRDKIDLLAKALQISPSEFISTDVDDLEMSKEDHDRLEALHQNPKLGLLFDRAQNLDPEDVDFMLTYADRILKEREGD